jgi:phosphoglycerate dehydrogenase-like enzyme
MPARWGSSVARPPAALAMSALARERLFTPEALARLAEVAEIDTGTVITDFAAGGLADIEVLVTGWGCPPVDADVLAAAPRLRAIVHAAGSARGHVTEACWARGIVVSTAAAANAQPVAEFTLATILLANKATWAAERTYRERRARVDSLAEFPGIGNAGKTVGIVGASRIGRRVIALLAPFDLAVLVYDPYLADQLAAQPRELDALLAESDVVSLHAPSLPATRHMIDARRLALMRDGAVLINTARGALIDHAALLAELRTGRLSAVLDVTEPEPLPPGSPFYALPNVVLTPHIAGALGTEVHRLGDAAIAELARYAAGEPFAQPLTAADRDRVA